MEKFAFTCGDINGVGPEIVIKTINKIYNKNKYKFYFLCPRNIFEITAEKTQPSFPFCFKKKIAEDETNNVSIIDFAQGNQELSKPTKQSGKISYKAVHLAFKAAVKNKIDAIVTAPISKTALKLAGINYPGHTEMLADWSRTKKFMMTFLSSNIKCGLITIHEPINKVSSLINVKKIMKSIDIVLASLQNDFGITNPKVAILGLNPHAGENGFIGNEEERIIRPALEKTRYKNYCDGPFVPDAFFANKLYLQYDFVIGMYHDQLLIPFKLLNFNTGVNYTAGLPIIRTSPDHGTAYDIAGKGIADESSMIDAFFWAENILQYRKVHARKK